jgi:predicted nuclease with RNAse H fold/dephospho-CoA kinase
MLPLREPPVVPTEAVPRFRRPGRSGRRYYKGLDRAVPSTLADPASVVFLDIETTGLSWFYDELTVAGWARGGIYRIHVAGEDPSPLLNVLKSASALVTFNGTLFDLRFLKKQFGELALPPVHIDLRYLAKRAGLTGGQKAIEKTLNIPVRDGVEDLDGAAAVLLWRKYLRGDHSALVRLVDYNLRDVAGMCAILDGILVRLDLHPDLLFSSPNFSVAARAILQQGNPDLPVLNPSRTRVGTEFDLIFGGTTARNAVIVGLDLTGSEKRASGWCVLRGREATTCRVSSDEEILVRSLAVQPALVSIDSPLSLPFGRISAGDDDPGREQHGIMRECERELKRRGINVYPCLLPSMQGLTRRGMRLAEKFRSLGIPVIESYPGAAQDIMGIPRKGVGANYLKEGLVNFGIRGPFTEAAISHDELDAITSATVGSFFLSNRFEALRGPREGALIIPDRKEASDTQMVIGVSGRICAGKTTTARILQRQGFTYTRFSLVIDDEIAALGAVPDRASRQRVGMELHRTKGQRWLCEKVLKRVGGSRLVVVDGLRFPEDRAFFVEQFGSNFAHVHLTAPAQMRAHRYRQVGEDDSPFEVVEQQPVEAKVDDLASFASVVLDNEGSVAQLAEKVLNYVNALSEGRDSGCLFRS